MYIFLTKKNQKSKKNVCFFVIVVDVVGDVSSLASHVYCNFSHLHNWFRRMFSHSCIWPDTLPQHARVVVSACAMSFCQWWTFSFSFFFLHSFHASVNFHPNTCLQILLSLTNYVNVLMLWRIYKQTRSHTHIGSIVFGMSLLSAQPFITDGRWCVCARARDCHKRTLLQILL